MAEGDLLDDEGAIITIGGLSRDELTHRLRDGGVQVNAHAETLLADDVFDAADPATTLRVVTRTVADLGLHDGAPLSRVIEAVRENGFELCPATTGPYLRLLLTQRSVQGAVQKQGRAPSGSLTVLSRPLRDDDEYPKGFYLRVVDGVSWLRGYRCDDQHRWAPHDVLVLRAPEVS